MFNRQEKIDWDVRYSYRLERLSKLIAMNAPQIIIDGEARLVRKAIHRGLWPMLWHDIKGWWLWQRLKVAELWSREGDEDGKAK